MKFRTQFTYESRSDGYKNRQPSMTVPGQAYSIQQAVERLRAGLPVKVTGFGYNPDGLPLIKDLTDIEQLRQLVQNKELTLKQKVKEFEAKLKQTTDQSATTPKE